MIIKTNLSWNTLSQFSAMQYNHGADLYTADGENMVEIIENNDDPDFILDADFLISDCDWQISALGDLSDDTWLLGWDRSYRQGDRCKAAVDCHRERNRYLSTIRKWKKAFAEWKSSIVEVEPWEYDTDTVQFIEHVSGDKAVAIIKEEK